MNEHLIKITKYNVLGKLPSLLKFNDGTFVTKETFEKRKKELYKTAVEMQFGTMPPKPEFLDVEPLYLSFDEKGASTYRIITGKKDYPFSFTMRIINGKKINGKKPAAVVDGDLCFGYFFDKELLNIFLENGISVVLFNRVEIAADRKQNGRTDAIYNCYNEYKFGAIAAWAWGYSRCVDALEVLSRTDNSCIAFTGHSRGGKTALLAGVCDSRAVIVNPNDSGAGGTGCYRLNIEAENENGEIKRNETLSDLFKNFPYWFSQEMKNFEGKEELLPFDQHFLKALIAPRILFDSEAASDIWANPVGSWQTTCAAKEVFDLLNVPENLIWYYRKGFHSFKAEDAEHLVNVINHYRFNEKLKDDFYKKPFESFEPIF